MKTVTILLPAYNEAESFAELKECMTEVAQPTTVMSGSF